MEQGHKQTKSEKKAIPKKVEKESASDKDVELEKLKEDMTKMLEITPVKASPPPSLPETERKDSSTTTVAQGLTIQQVKDLMMDFKKEMTSEFKKEIYSSRQTYNPTWQQRAQPQAQPTYPSPQYYYQVLQAQRQVPGHYQQVCFNP